jgi:4-methyl-5(b-hydroxyethyl)-thiazole monophosphate biosynthesis
MSFKIAVILAEGFEEVEAIAPIDVMRRAGLEVVLVGLTSKMVKASHGLVVQADLLLSELHGLPDAIVLPGGLPGAKYLGESKEVKQLVQKMNESKKWVTAICASPALVLAPAGVLNQKKATCYPVLASLVELSRGK